MGVLERLAAVVLISLMITGQVALGSEVVLRTGSFEEYQASVMAMNEANGADVAEKAVFSLIILAWQATAPETPLAEWGGAMGRTTQRTLQPFPPLKGYPLNS